MYCISLMHVHIQLQRVETNYKGPTNQFLLSYYVRFISICLQCVHYYSKPNNAQQNGSYQAEICFKDVCLN